MSSGDYIDLLNIISFGTNGTTSSEQTQSVMMDTITNNSNNYFNIPLCNSGATGICIPTSASTSIIPGYSSVGRTGPTGPTGQTGPKGIGVEGPPGLSLEYNLFLSPSQTIVIPDISGNLIEDPSMNSVQSSLSYTFEINDASARLLGVFTTNFIDVTTTSIAPGLWDLNLYAISNYNLTCYVAFFMRIYYVDASGNEVLVIDGENVSTPITNNSISQRYVNSLFFPFFTLPDLNSNIRIKVFGKQYGSNNSIANNITIFFNAPTMSYIRTTLANQILPIGPTGATGATGPTGATGATGPTVWSQEDGYVYYMGNVGISTSAPAYTLDVSGTLRANYIVQF